MLLPLIEEKLRKTVERHADLEKQLSDPDVASQPSRFRMLSRECGTAAKLVERFRLYTTLKTSIEENEALKNDNAEDPELREMAGEEIERLQPEFDAVTRELTNRILVEDKDAGRNVIMEIRAGTGGDEAALFAGDLFRMYLKLAERKGWKVEILDANGTDLGGFKEIIFSVGGDNVHGNLRYEMGGHRVQRVPSTETSGRIHTSAATVAVMGEPEEIEVEIDESDVKMDFFRASGPGGQKVNKTSSAVRLTHLPSGIVVSIQDEVSQHKNRAKAMRVLRTRLYEHTEQERRSKEQDQRRNQIGSGDRSQRIRTYNFPQNRVTDHRISQNFNLERVIKEGELEPVIEAMRTHDREERIKAL
jgi:peptide chain release factor 1